MFSDIIKVEHLSKSFGNLKTFDDISFEVKEGKIFGFLGPNDAGKTTINMLTTLEENKDIVIRKDE
jgi:multidrug/hemolysin transport system ATP-binding protein